MSRSGRCLACGRRILWKRTVNDKWTPEDPDGKTHWATCSEREKFEEFRSAVRSEKAEGRQLEMVVEDGQQNRG